jgi:hypothetical protein
MRPGKTYLYLLEFTPEEVKQLKLIDDSVNTNNEILQSKWVYIGDFNKFRKSNPVNKTISDFNIEYFLELSGINISSQSQKIDSFSFRKSRKISRKSRKVSRKAKKIRK